MTVDNLLNDVRFRFMYNNRIFLELNNGTSYFIRPLDDGSTEFSVTKVGPNDSTVVYDKNGLEELISKCDGVNLSLTLFVLRAPDIDPSIITEF